MRRLFANAGVRVLTLFAAGILCCRFHPLPFEILWASAATAWTAACAVRIVRRGRAQRSLTRTTCVAAVCFTSGMLLIRIADLSVDTSLVRFADTNEPMTIAGTVSSSPEQSRRVTTFLLRCDSVMGTGDTAVVSSLTSVSLFAGDDSDSTGYPQPGDRLHVRGKLTSPRPIRNPGGFDARSFAVQRGIATQFRVSGMREISVVQHDSVRTAATVFRGVRRSLFERLDALFPREDSDMLRGLLFGDRSRIDPDISRIFRESGVIHILSVSGTHVGILLAIVWLLLGRFRLTLRVSIALLTLWGYAMLTDMSPPVLRSAVMATMFLAAMPLQRVTDSINIWAVSGVVLLAMSPRDLFSPSFQLSFCAVLSILLFHRRMVAQAQASFPRMMQRPPIRGIVVLCILTFTAQLGTFPFIVMYFRQVSIVSLVANLFIVPLTSVVMATALPALVFSFAGDFPAAQLAAAAHGSLRLVVRLSGFFAGLPYAVVSVQSLPIWVSLLYGLALMWIHTLRRRIRSRMIIAAFATAAIAVCASGIRPAPLESSRLSVTALDVSQGDAILIRAPDGHAMLIDTGPSLERGDEAERTILPALRALGIDSLRVLMLTHFDDDHAGGAGTIMRSITVCLLVTPVPAPTDTTAQQLVETARSLSVPWMGAERGTAFEFSDAVHCEILAPGPAPPANANAQSIVSLLEFGNTRVLCTGDAPIEVENDIVRRYGPLLRADLCKIGHHGSRTSTGVALLDAVKPEMSVRNTAHPARESR